MTDDARRPGGPDTFERVDPYDLARREKAAAQLKRFYKGVAVAERSGRFLPMLDGRPLRTPGRNEVSLPSRDAARQVADEWERQGDVILPGGMPATRLVNTAIDGVARAMDPVRAEVVKFAGSDLLCYRADGPVDLVERQAREWDPVLAWARDDLGARFFLAQGVMFVDQPHGALEAVDRAVATGVGSGEAASFRLAALHVMTTLTGSALLGLAVLSTHLPADEAWRKAHVDEDFQIERWGADEEAAERRAHRWADMVAAATLAACVGA